MLSDDAVIYVSKSLAPGEEAWKKGYYSERFYESTQIFREPVGKVNYCPCVWCEGHPEYREVAKPVVYLEYGMRKYLNAMYVCEGRVENLTEDIIKEFKEKARRITFDPFPTEYDG